jgi:hypothetical protein
MTETTDTQAPQPSAPPNPLLRSLDPLVGTWNVSGPGLKGQVTFEWMAGGFFLLQHIDLDQEEQQTKGIEIIGYDPGSGTLKSHFFGSTGEILEYTWQLSGDTLTIWYGEEGSPAKFTGTFSPGGKTNTGAWEWPGGGYESNMTRVG